MENLMETIKKKMKACWPVLAFALLFAFILYSTFMSQQLTNTIDGFWNQNYFAAGRWELSQGRWLLPYMDRLHAKLHLDPAITMATLALFVCGFLLALDIFHVKGKALSFLASALFLSSTAVCVTVSYKYTSLSYGLSFFLSVCGVHVLAKGKRPVLSVGAASICICMFMALYQAYFSVFCFLALLFFLYITVSGRHGWRAVGGYVLKTAVSCLAGMGLYYLSLMAHLKLLRTEVTEYHGASRVNPVNMMAQLPQSLLKTYRLFWQYFTTGGFKLNAFQDFKLLHVTLAVLVLILLVGGVKLFRENRGRLLLYVPGALLLPVSCNAILLIATEAGLQLQMTAALAMVFPMLLIFAYSLTAPGKVWRTACGLLGAVVLWGNMLQVWLDQNAMYEGQIAVSSMGYEIVHDLDDRGLLSADREYFFVGKPAGNRLFYTSPLYQKANSYARVGDFSLSGNCMLQSYRGMFNYLLGINILLTSKDYEELAYMDEVKGMPSFPEEGYIRESDGLVIVKISD